VDDEDVAVSEYDHDALGYLGRRKAKQALRGMSRYRWRPREVEIPAQWDAAHVMHRLVDAYKTLGKLPAAKGSKPAQYGNAWPQHCYDFSDLVAQSDKPPEELKADANRRNWTRQLPAREEITHMDLLFNTVYQFRKDHPTECNMLLVWAHARCVKVNLEKIFSRFEVSRNTYMARVQFIASLCSDYLNRHNVRTW